jgi:hypothetical protein
VGGHLLKPYVAEDELLWLNGERHGARASADPSRTADRVTLELLTLMRSPHMSKVLQVQGLTSTQRRRMQRSARPDAGRARAPDGLGSFGDGVRRGQGSHGASETQRAGWSGLCRARTASEEADDEVVGGPPNHSQPVYAAARVER